MIYVNKIEQAMFRISLSQDALLAFLAPVALMLGICIVQRNFEGVHATAGWLDIRLGSEIWKWKTCSRHSEKYIWNRKTWRYFWWKNINTSPVTGWFCPPTNADGNKLKFSPSKNAIVGASRNWHCWHFQSKPLLPIELLHPATTILSYFAKSETRSHVFLTQARLGHSVESHTRIVNLKRCQAKIDVMFLKFIMITLFQWSSK